MYDWFSTPDEGGMTLTNFVHLCRHNGLLSKQLLPRDVEQLFHRNKASVSDHAVSYNQFRMKVLPELANKTRQTILDVVKACHHCGPPRRSASHK